MTLIPFPICQRCRMPRPITHRVTSDIINIRVCAVCAAEADRLKSMPHIAIRDDLLRLAGRQKASGDLIVEKIKKKSVDRETIS